MTSPMNNKGFFFFWVPHIESSEEHGSTNSDSSPFQTESHYLLTVQISLLQFDFPFAKLLSYLRKFMSGMYMQRQLNKS